MSAMSIKLPDANGAPAPQRRPPSSGPPEGGSDFMQTIMALLDDTGAGTEKAGAPDPTSSPGDPMLLAGTVTPNDACALPPSPAGSGQAAWDLGALLSGHMPPPRDDAAVPAISYGNTEDPRTATSRPSLIAGTAARDTPAPGVRSMSSSDPARIFVQESQQPGAAVHPAGKAADAVSSTSQTTRGSFVPPQELRDGSVLHSRPESTAVDTENGHRGTRDALPPAAPVPDTFAAMMPASTTAVAGNAEPVAVHHSTLNSTPDQAAFHPELAAEVRTLTKDGVQHAHLQLHPSELGPILIDMRITGQVADISFTAQHAATREGITQSVEHLREMLAGEGLRLGQAHVGADTPRQQAEQRAHPAPAMAMAVLRLPMDGNGPDLADIRHRTAKARGGLDLYA